MELSCLRPASANLCVCITCALLRCEHVPQILLALRRPSKKAPSAAAQTTFHWRGKVCAGAFPKAECASQSSVIRNSSGCRRCGCLREEMAWALHYSSLIACFPLAGSTACLLVGTTSKQTSSILIYTVSVCVSVWQKPHHRPLTERFGYGES
jgi:hypothetical protein